MTPSDKSCPEPASSQPEVVGVIVGYGELPAALRAAALSIVDQPEALETVSNVSRRAEGLNDKLDEVATRHPGSTILLFADLYGSSCAIGSGGFRARHPGTAVLCGVNLAMLVRFLCYRRRLSYEELTDFLLRTGREEIRPA